MKTIPLHPSGEAIVDDDDYDMLMHFQWRVLKAGYAMRSVSGVNGDKFKSKIVYMHRLIMEPCEPFHVDHKNGNRLDNRKSNLRLVLPVENAWNRDSLSLKRKKYSQYFGVCFNTNAWTARVTTPTGKGLLLGRFNTELEAAVAYDIASKEHWGDLARLNFPQGLPDIVPVKRSRNRVLRRIAVDCGKDGVAKICISHPNAIVRDRIASAISAHLGA